MPCCVRWRGQEDRGFEVLVADDGSGPATAALVEQWKPRLGVPLDACLARASRLSRRRNPQSRDPWIAAATIVVFLDGDCLARPDFVATHRRLAEPGWFVTGNRALLTKALTEAVLRGQLEPERWGLADWLGAALQRRAQSPRAGAAPAARAAAQDCGRRPGRARARAISRSGAPISTAVDGFDASFSGWGKEDSDLLVRLLHAGVRRKDGAFATGVLHLWHPDADRSQLAENERLLADVCRKRARARRGGGCRRSRRRPSRGALAR